jgi:hypothetical protein
MSIDDATPQEWDALRNQINNPQHYRSGGMECIDVIEAQLSDEEFVGYLRGNAIKYQWRMMKKHERPLRDAGKLQFYVNRLLEVLGAT